MKNILRFLFVVVCLSTHTNPLHAQWIQTNGPYSGIVNAFAVCGTNLFAGTYGSGVFLSANNGTSWTAAKTGLTNPFINALAVSPASDGTGGTNLFAGTNGGVFLSANNGTNWTPVNTGLTNTTVRALAFSGTNLFAGTDGGVFLSANNGTSWTEANTGLTNTYVKSLAVSPASDGTGGTNLFAGTYDGGVFLSVNNGTSWTAESTGLMNTDVRALALSPASDGTGGTNLFAGTNGSGVFLSTNNGTSWTAESIGLMNTDVRALALSPASDGTGGMNLFAGTSGGVWRRPLSEMMTSVETLSTKVPTNSGLDQNYPNPFNPTTTISFRLPSQSYVSLKVFNSLGREVSILLEKKLSAGTYVERWDAQGLPSGVYFCRLQTGSFTETKKILLQR